MTLEEFEARYAAESGVTAAQLRSLGLYPAPCDCGEDGCEGWQMDWDRRHAILEAARRHVSDAFICPVCAMISHHPDDVAKSYCGNCHEFRP